MRMGLVFDLPCPLKCFYIRLMRSFGLDLLQGMAGVTGLEPAASGVTGRRSNQLSYTPNREV